MGTLLKKTKDLEEKIDLFLDLVVNGGFLLKQGIKHYIKRRY